MSARSVVIVEHERGIIRPTDGDLLLSKPEAGAGQGTGREEQALRLTASGPLGSGWLDGAGSRLPPLLTRGRGRAEQVRAYHAHRRDDEQPQDREEREPDEGESERVHRVICPSGWPWPVLVVRSVLSLLDINRCRLCGTPESSAPVLLVCRHSATPAGPAAR